ncbi:MAG TPA: extracellular solute-binding protein [Micromonosporaceae bacterium]|nr:extracellular solute-binding protein [Micromonosporaceae bacterium]
MGLTTGRRGAAAIAIASVAVLLVSACGDDSGSETGSGTKSDEKIELTVDVFGDQGFGYEELYKQYQTDHPNITIKERGKGLGGGDYSTKLTQWMTSGAGAGDVVAIEEGQITQLRAQPANFVNLADHGAESLKGDYLPWKWDQGLSADKKTIIGLGTDVGGMAICYRTDLFQAAGLPTDREAVGALWKDWDAYIATGKQYASRAKGSKFVDAATNLYNTILMQKAGAGTGHTYFDESNKMVLDSNPDVKAAWDTTTAAVKAGLSANLKSFSPEWTTGFKQAQFATIGCPGWMTGVIKGQAGDEASGKWDVAKAPGGGGNWGGSFLAVPKQGKHPKEAAELAKFLTNTAAQVEAFKKLGNLPSSTKALADPAVTEFKNPYFNNAPTGQIFGAGATALKPVFLGAKNQAVRDEVENALRTVEQGSKTPEAAWQDAVKNGTSAGK